MRELMKNAQLGWLQYTSDGKLAALLLVALLLLWFGQREIKEKYRVLIWYTTLMTIACICPITVMVLMRYQTKFYDYQWVWSTVPVTVVIAFTITVFWSFMMEKYGKTNRNAWKKIGITVALVALICVSGSTQKPVAGMAPDGESRKDTSEILEKINEMGQDTCSTIWAPREIMEYARALDGRVYLPYGRNMWDAALNAYSYDVYGPKQEALCEWMTRVEETGTVENLSECEWLDIARELGVTHMVLPKETKPELLTVVEESLDVSAVQVRDYYLYCLQ